jgi:hypothetical protein
MKYAHEDIATLINTFVEQAEAVARLLADRHGLPIGCAHVQNALVETLALDDSTELLDLRLTKAKILSALEQYDFRKLFPVLLAEVTFEHSILPPGVPRKLVEQRVRHRGEVWQINQNDADPFPSNPHGHNLESGHKLDLSTGELYSKRRAVGRKIPRKDLLAIREKATGVNLPPLA